MHRSRLSTLLIDVRAEEAFSSAAFWSATLCVIPVHSDPVTFNRLATTW